MQMVPNTRCSQRIRSPENEIGFDSFYLYFMYFFYFLIFLYLYLMGHFCRLPHTPKIGRELGWEPSKGNLILLSLLLFHVFVFIFLYFCICI